MGWCPPFVEICDVVTSVVCSSWKFSSWEAYVGALVGGVIGGVLTLCAGPVTGAGVGAGASQASILVGFEDFML